MWQINILLLHEPVSVEHKRLFSWPDKLASQKEKELYWIIFKGKKASSKGEIKHKWHKVHKRDLKKNQHGNYRSIQQIKKNNKAKQKPKY